MRIKTTSASLSLSAANASNNSSAFCGFPSRSKARTSPSVIWAERGAVALRLFQQFQSIARAATRVVELGIVARRPILNREIAFVPRPRWPRPSPNDAPFLPL